MTDLAAGLTEKRIRELVIEIRGKADEARCHAEVGIDYDRVLFAISQKANKALALPKTQAEKQAEALMELMKAIEHLYSLKPVPGNGWATLSDAGAAHNDVEKKLKACREAGLE